MLNSGRPQNFRGAPYRLLSSNLFSKVTRWTPLIAVLSLTVWLRVVKLDLFYGRDELVIWRWSDEFFSSLWRGDLANSVLDSDYPGVTIYWLQSLYNYAKYGFIRLTSGYAPQLGTFVEVPRSLSYLAERRLVMGLATSAQVWAFYALAVKSFNRRLALLAAFFVAVDPFFLAESRLLRAESLAAGFMILSILSWLIYLRENKWRYLALSGLMAGWAILTKVSSIFLFPIIGLVLLFDLFLARRETWRAQLKLNIKQGLAWSGLAALGFWLSWPTLWVNPLPPLETLFVRGVAQASRVSTWHGDVFFAGRLIPDDPGLLFYPVAIAYRSTPIVWLGAGLAVLILVRSLANAGAPIPGGAVGNPSARRWSWPVVSIGVLFLYIGATFVLLSLTLSKVDRYLLPILPPLGLLAAFGLLWLYGWIADKGKQWRWVAGIGLLVACIGQLGLTLSSYPYFYSYWNPLLGGAAAAVKTLPVGSGEGLDKGIEFLNQLPNAEDLTLVCGASQAWCEGNFVGTTWPYKILATGEWMRADYVLFYIAWAQRQMYAHEAVEYLSRLPPYYKVELGGAVYAWLYKVPEVQYASGTKLEGRGTLYGYNLSTTQLQAGEVLTATLFWRNEGRQPEDTFFVEMVDAAGYPWSKALAQPRLGFGEAYQTRGAILESEARLKLPIGMPPGHYFLKMGFATDNGQTLVGRFELPSGGDDVLVKLPADFLLLENEVPVSRHLKLTTEDLYLLGYDLSQVTVQPEERIWLTLFWQAKQNSPRDYVIGIRLLTADGHEVTYWLGRPFHSGYPTPLWSSGQVVQDPWELTMPEELASGDYQLELVLFDAETQVEAAKGTLANLSAVGRKRSFDIPRMQKAVDLTLGDRIKLFGYDLSVEPGLDGGYMWVTLYWQTQAMMDRSYWVFVHLIGPDGTLIAQHEGVPANGTIPTDDWAIGEVVADHHGLALEDSVLTPGKYRIVVGMYDPTTGQRLRAGDGGTSILLQTFVRD